MCCNAASIPIQYGRVIKGQLEDTAALLTAYWSIKKRYSLKFVDLVGFSLKRDLSEHYISRLFELCQAYDYPKSNMIDFIERAEDGKITSQSRD
jgi:hypothetical protein